MIIELVGVRARRWPSVGDLRRWSDQSDHLIWMLSHCQLLFSPSIFKYCQVLSYQVLSSSIVIKYCQVLSVMSSMAGKDHLIWMLSPFFCQMFTYQGQRGPTTHRRQREGKNTKARSERAGRIKERRRGQLVTRNRGERGAAGWGANGSRKSVRPGKSVTWAPLPLSIVKYSQVLSIIVKYSRAPLPLSAGEEFAKPVFSLAQLCCSCALLRIQI